MSAPASVSAVTAAPPVLTDPVTQFNAWIDRYRGASTDAEKAVWLKEGALLAAARRDHLFDLIKTDPEAALAAAVPLAWRAELPEPIQGLLEERVSGRAFFGVLVADDLVSRTSHVIREVVVNQRRYEAYVYGRRLAQVTQERTPLWGIAVATTAGARLAVHPDPVRRLEPGERPPPPTGRERCPVSQQPSIRGGNETLAEVGGVVERFCGVGHLEALNERLAEDVEGGGGGAGSGGSAAPGQESWSQGPKTCLFMRVAFPDDPGEPISEDAAYALMDSVNRYYIENSYGTTSILPAVTPLLLLPQPKEWYAVQGTGTLLGDARELARQAGYDTDQFHWDIVRHNNVPGFGFSGLALVRGKGTWLQSSSVGVACHELGHNYGLWHANFWNATGDGVIGPGVNVEYGNVFDTMGAASAGNNQFNTAMKNQLDWLPEAFVRTVIASGTYRVHAFDVPGLVPGRSYALKVRKDYDRNYWAEFRQKFASNRWLQHGVLLNWDPWNNGASHSAGGTHLLDTTPGTGTGNNGKDDAAVVIGRTFSDAAAGVHLTPLARSSVSGENWIDVAVQLGDFAGNLPPQALLVCDRTNAQLNATVFFSVTSSDPEGDPLAYAWDFGDDTFGFNLPYATKSWTNPGDYAVRCTVSDMKGGQTTQQRLVRVGQPDTFGLSGRILTAGEGLPLAGVRVHNAQTGSSYRGCYTGSDGRYVLANLTTGTVSVAAVKYGYTLAPTGWTNPISLKPDPGSRDWIALPSPVVSLAAIDALAAEAPSDPARFRLSRVGSTQAPLTVKLARSGSSSVTDYSVTPALSNTPVQATLPAGAAHVDLVISPVNDVVSEGLETLTLTLIADAAYVLGPLAEATVTIADDDAAGKPRVAVSVTSPAVLADNLSVENGADTMTFSFTRSGGNPESELVVSYSVGGTATAGVDYPALPGVIAIPPGSSSVTLSLASFDDLEVEPIETVVITLLPDPAYDGAGDSATGVIVDQDPPTVTITATDRTGREGGSSTGTFTVTRVGSLAPNLAVNYTLSGTASNGVDFTALSGTVTIPAGRATAPITLTALNDTRREGDETVWATLEASAAYNVGNPGSALFTIVDDELPTVTLAATDATAAEPGSDGGVFTFTRTGSLTEALTIVFRVSGTAVPGADYAADEARVVIPAGSSNAFWAVSVLDDPIKEADEKVTLMLQTDPLYNVGTGGPQSVTIKDDDAGLPGVGFTFAGSSGPENVSLVRLSVGLSTNASSRVTVQYAVSGGTAGGGADYLLNAGTLAFAPGVANQSVNLSIMNDGLVESNETLVVTLSNPTNALLDAISTHTYTILDEDSSGAVTVSVVDGLAAEGAADPAIFRISRSGATGDPQQVFFQLAGTASQPSDFSAPREFVWIAADAASVDVVVEPVDDVTAEGDETVVLNLTRAPGARLGSPDAASLLILDNDDSSDLPVITVEAVDAQAAEPGLDTGTVVVRRVGGTNEALVVSFLLSGNATSGSDYTSAGSSVAIPAGAAEAAIRISPRDDTSFELTETVTVTLTQVPAYRVGQPSSATVLLEDNEVGVSVIAEGAAAEDGSSVGSFQIIRTGSTASNLAVNFAVGGTASVEDFLPLATGLSVMLPGGTNRMRLPVVAIDDPVADGGETVVLTLAEGTGYALGVSNTATVVIADDEPEVSIFAADALAYEGGGDDGRVTVRRAGSTNGPLTVRLMLAGSAAAGEDYLDVGDSIVIPSGAISVDLVIVGRDDVLREGLESVRVEVLPDPAYALTAASTATVAVVDDETNKRPTVTLQSPAVPIVFLDGTNGGLVLEARVVDDGQPSPPAALATTWSLVHGPSRVTFGNSNALETTAHFSAAGSYLLRLSATDGQLSADQELRVEIDEFAGDPPGNLAPRVDAGPPQSLPLGTPAVLRGVVSDDGRPGPPMLLTVLWTQVAGPSAVSFVEPSALETTASFSEGGGYVLRLVADDGEVKMASDVRLRVIAPTVVSVQAVDSTASEFGGDASQGTPGAAGSHGVFAVQRQGDLSSAVTVFLSLAGTASRALDYLAISNVVVLPPQIASAFINVVPLRDGLPEGEETVQLALVPDPGYGIGVPAADTVFIQDAPWDDWRWSRFTAPELAEASISGPLADPDRDGWWNLLEYACGRDPKSADAGGDLTGAFEGGAGTVGGQRSYVTRFHRRLEPTDLVYEIEVSSDLKTWIRGGNVARELLPRIDDGNDVTATARVQIFGSGPGARWVRLKVRLLGP